MVDERPNEDEDPQGEEDGSASHLASEEPEEESEDAEHNGSLGLLPGKEDNEHFNKVRDEVLDQIGDSVDKLHRKFELKIETFERVFRSFFADILLISKHPISIDEADNNGDAQTEAEEGEEREVEDSSQEKEQEASTKDDS